MNTKTTALLAMAAGAHLSAQGVAIALQELQRPNILFILTDDQGYGDLECHGHPFLKTPNLDRLYDQSVRFDRVHASASCAPSRAALMTGMHEFRNGVTHTIPPREHLSKDAVLLPQLLKTAGYATAWIGKWHLGDSPGHRAEDRGFDHTFYNQGGTRTHFDCIMTRNGKHAETTGFREDLFTDEAIEFMTDRQDRPFFCYLATFSPHTPLAAPEEFIAPYRGLMSDEEATFLGMIGNIDYNVGRLLDFLDQSGLAENTIVIFMNDNGETMGLDLYNAGMRGCKTTPWEGGSRAMSLWRWPNQWEPRTESALTAHLDLLPTLCELAGVKIPQELQEKLDGSSLVPLLESEEGDFPRDRMLFMHPGRWVSGTALDHKYALGSVRQGDWYLTRAHPCSNPECFTGRDSVCAAMHRVQQGATRATYTATNAAYHWGSFESGRWSLFNLKDDPGSRDDRAGDYPAVVERLSAAYEQWWDSLFPGILLNEPEAENTQAMTLSAGQVDTPVPGYPTGIRAIRYPVPEDGSEQPALFWAPDLPAGKRAPLLVALHTWSGDYRQAGGQTKYAEWCLKAGWIFVHPNFRGPNRTPDALGSDLMIADIRAVVEWARREFPVDEDRIYAIGGSGGGHAAMLLAGRIPGTWAGISSWCGISDIAAWHAETIEAGNAQYAQHIEKALGGQPDASEAIRAEATRRSPLSWLGNAAAIPLDLNHGIHDGRNGSVPFTHSLRAWNAVVPEADRIPEARIAAWYDDPASLPRDPRLKDPLYSSRPALFRKTHGNTRITIFEGGHEIDHEAGLNWLAAQRKGQPANWHPPKIATLRATDADRKSGK
jgi:arylsulfatase A-like enzyme/dienelactone hydrolase